MNKISIILSTLLITGCTADGGDVALEDKNKLVTCTDTRDGEVFQFNTNNISNIRQGFGVPHSMDIVTLDGRKMTVTSAMEAWLKCTKKEIE